MYFYMQWYIQSFDISKIKLCENFSSNAPKSRFIFYTSFTYGLQKIFMNKNICSKADLYLLHLLKCIIRNIYLKPNDILNELVPVNAKK